MGPYQVRMIFFLTIINYLAGGLFIISPYLFYQDPYECEGMSKDACFEQVCTLSPLERESYIPPPSIKSIANHFGDYRCHT